MDRLIVDNLLRAVEERDNRTRMLGFALALIDLIPPGETVIVKQESPHEGCGIEMDMTGTVSDHPFFTLKHVCIKGDHNGQTEGTTSEADEASLGSASGEEAEAPATAD